ncbi:MAG: Lar family restriction alleviation protein, partial [Sedimentisphaerales bacterium]|nr:Lar family restriction alleviation protein [Sedimentisphaerales bacterium]
AVPCPFCGCERVSTQKIAGLFYAGCDDCYAGAKWDADRLVAINNWNKRFEMKGGSDGSRK